ncbi:hypothetical protein CU079_05935 [Citrobacter freundii]|nr:hypothetical protein CU079_05935 [Citrobacter freundii]
MWIAGWRLRLTRPTKIVPASLHYVRIVAKLNDLPINSALKRKNKKIAFRGVAAKRISRIMRLP